MEFSRYVSWQLASVLIFAGFLHTVQSQFFGFPGIIPNPFAIWAYGGPGIGAQYPDPGLAGLADDLITLPQQNPPAPAAATAADKSAPAASSSAGSNSSSSAADAAVPVDTRSVRKSAGNKGSNAVSAPGRVSLLEKQTILNASISALAEQILDEQSGAMMKKGPMNGKKMTTRASLFAFARAKIPV